MTRYKILDFDNCLVMQPDIILEVIVDVYTQTTMEYGSPHSYEETKRILVDSFIKTGLGHTEFAQYGIDIDALYIEVHKRLLSHARDHFNPPAYKPLIPYLECPQTQYCILTHGTKEWAKEATRIVGLDTFFPDERIIGLDDIGAEHPKSVSKKGFQVALDVLGLSETDIPHEEIYFIDDSAKNLPVPHSMGLSTVHVGPKINDYTAADYIAYRYPTLLRFLETFRPKNLRPKLAL